MTLNLCEWCNEDKVLTQHHEKYRNGIRVSWLENRKVIYKTISVCRPCHDEIERDYELINKAIPCETKYDILMGIQKQLKAKHSLKWYTQTTKQITTLAKKSDNVDLNVELLNQIHEIIIARVKCKN